MATYNAIQLSQYFERIGYSREHHGCDRLAFLSGLIKHQLTSIPFETLSLHYSVDKSISLDPEHLFRKLVGRKRGGYCQENNTFFGVVLRSLGFRVYGVICRSSNASRGLPGNGWRAMSHMANIVTINDKKYMVDVGYGPNGPVVPMPLDPSGQIVLQGMSNQSIRLEQRSLSQHCDSAQKVWVYSHKLTLESPSPWIDLYHFPDVEFFLDDFDVLNCYNSTVGHWTKTVIAQRFIWGNGDGEPSQSGKELVGNLILLNDRFERRPAGKARGSVIQEFVTEEERIEALEKCLDIVLTKEEKSGIQGHASELRLQT